MSRTLAVVVLMSALLVAAAPAQAIQASASQSTRPAPTAGPTESSPINLNTATAPELEKLPGVGPATAARIVEFRTKNGAFKKIEDLMNVRGIGEKTFLTLKPLVTVAPPKGGQ